MNFGVVGHAYTHAARKNVRVDCCAVKVRVKSLEFVKRMYHHQVDLVREYPRQEENHKEQQHARICMGRGGGCDVVNVCVYAFFCLCVCYG